MPKFIKGIAGKKPPEPFATEGDIDAWLVELAPRLKPIAEYVDGLIRETIPGLQFTLKRNRPLYGLPKHGWLIEIAPYSVSVNVMFYGGAEFDPEPPLGGTDRTRYIKLTSLEDAQLPELASWIKQAARTPGWK